VVGLVWKVWLRATSRTTESERGASLVEYALLLALIAVVCWAAAGLLGNSASTRLSGFGGSLGTGS
jgi:pilus assembly protein Flp/PilA